MAGPNPREASSGKGLTCTFYDQAMNESDMSGPDPETIHRYIVDTFPGVQVATAMAATFYSLDEKHFPNFATIVTTDDHDDASNLSRPGIFRLNIGVSRPTFERFAAAAGEAPDYTVLDVVIPHPVYAKQLWLSILNPSGESWEAVVKPLLAEAHDRLAAQRTRHAKA
jgi:hypothetical protein